MRSTRLTAGLLVLAAPTAGGCGTRTQGPPVTDSTVAPAPPPVTQAPAATVPMTHPVDSIDDGSAARPPATTSTTATAAPAGTAPELSSDEVEQLLAQLDPWLACLDRLLNDATAAMAAEEGEIIP